MIGDRAVNRVNPRSTRSSRPDAGASRTGPWGAFRMGRWLCAAVIALAACNPPADAEPRALAFLDMLVAGEFTAAAAVCDAQLQRSLPPPQLESLWRSLSSRHGAYMDRTVVE